MVNFRFHLVSLTAVFLALGLGLVIGSTVVDRVTVETIERQLEDVRTRAEEVNALNAELQASLEAANAFAERAAGRLVESRLTNVPVAVFTVAGGPEEATAQLESALAAAGADVRGRVSFTEKFQLDNDEAVAQLAEIVGVSAERPGVVRAAAVRQLANTLLTESGRQMLTALVDAGFVSYEGRAALSQLFPPGTRAVVVSDDEVAVANDALLIPFARTLAAAGVPVIATQPAEEGPDGEPGPLAFVRAFREGDENAVTTVDGVDAFAGRAGVVLALEEVERGAVGHYGTGDGADEVLPPAPAE